MDGNGKGLLYVLVSLRNADHGSNDFCSLNAQGMGDHTCLLPRRRHALRGTRYRFTRRVCEYQVLDPRGCVKADVVVAWVIGPRKLARFEASKASKIGNIPARAPPPPQGGFCGEAGVQMTALSHATDATLISTRKAQTPQPQLPVLSMDGRSQFRATRRLPGFTRMLLRSGRIRTGVAPFSVLPRRSSRAFTQTVF
jgi:hypothetical protein